MTNEIIIYQPNEFSISLEVRVEEETVWLTQAQMAELFQTTRNNITLHISNVFKENELDKFSVCKNSLQTVSDGKKYKTILYNLDVIISVGYRVKSKRATQFRIWLNKVLKGYSVNKRIERIEDDVHYLKEKSKEFDVQIKAGLPPNQGIFYDGQIFDTYVFLSDLIKSAKQSIVLTDNYIDESVRTMLSKSKKGVSVIVYTDKITKQLELDLQKHNQQYPKIRINTYKKSHDRFIIIDNENIYHIGASLKDLGQKRFAFSKIEFNANDILSKLN